MQKETVIQYLAKVILLAIIYHLVARLGLQMAYVQANTSPVWPPSGIALAALLIFGMRYWVGIALGVVVGSLLTGAPVGLALGLGLANTLEALAGAYLLRRLFAFHTALDRIRDVVGLAAAAAASTTISATIGVATLFWVNQAISEPFFTLWATWWVGNLLGVLVVTPFILIWIKRFRRAVKRELLIEGVLFIALLVAVSAYVFETQSGASALHQALIYVIFPFAIWAALRMEQHGAVTTIAVVSGIAIWGTVHGTGPFSQLPLNDSLILLQTFTGVVALTSLTLAASASERRHAEQALNRRVSDLAALNDASEAFIGTINISALYQSVCRLAVERLGLMSAWIQLVDPHAENPVAAFPAAALAEHSAERIIATQRAMQTCQTVIHAGAGDQPVFAAFPLSYGGNTLGALCVLSDSEDGFSRDAILLLESYANLAVVAIQSAWLFDQVRIGNEQLHALSQRLIEVQEQERINLSRELHDESGQILAALIVRLGLLERDAESPQQMREHIAELKRIVTDILNNLHDLAVKLRPASLDHLGLVTALQQYVEGYARQYHLDVQFDAAELSGSRLPADVETALFRIVQESLTNVALHARASRVDVLLNRRNGCLVLTIEDNGVGFEPGLVASENRLGLFGMRERVQMLGGSLLVESSPGKGTIISVEVPYGDPGTHR